MILYTGLTFPSTSDLTFPPLYFSIWRMKPDERCARADARAVIRHVQQFSSSSFFWFCFLPVCVCSCDIPVFCGRPPSLIQHLPLSFRRKNLCIIFSLFSFNCRTSMLLYTQTSRGNMYKSEKGRNQPKKSRQPTILNSK